MKNLNCKNNASTCQGVEENIEKITVNDAYLNNFVVKDASLKDHNSS